MFVIRIDHNDGLIFQLYCEGRTYPPDSASWVRHCAGQRRRRQSRDPPAGVAGRLCSHGPRTFSLCGSRNIIISSVNDWIKLPMTMSAVLTEPAEEKHARRTLNTASLSSEAHYGSSLVNYYPLFENTKPHIGLRKLHIKTPLPASAEGLERPIEQLSFLSSTRVFADETRPNDQHNMKIAIP